MSDENNQPEILLKHSGLHFTCVSKVGTYLVDG